MKSLNIKKTYSAIFESYGDISIEKHINKIIELDAFLPYSSTFFCLTNTTALSFEYISKNFTACTMLNSEEMKQKGMQYFWSMIHPDDLKCWLLALNELMTFTLSEIPIEKRKQLSYTWNYRLKNGKDEYVPIIQNTTPLHFDDTGKPVIGLAHYTVLTPGMELPISASAKYLNVHNEYETIYFKNYSQQLLLENISMRERDIIRLLVLDHSSKAIGEKLHISPHTVDTHRRNILKKLNMKSTGELKAYYKTNLLD